MAIQRGQLLSNNNAWHEKRRYKVNAVVLYSGSVYQNTTGGNSQPSLLIDWIKLGIVSSDFSPYKSAIIWDGSAALEMPENVIITAVIVDRVPLNADEFDQSGTIVTISYGAEAGSKISFFGVTI